MCEKPPPSLGTVEAKIRRRTGQSHRQKGCLHACTHRSEGFGHAAGFSRQTGRMELTEQERVSRLSALNALMDLMRPSVQADGGDLVLIRADVDTGVVEVQLQGACSSCAVSSATLSGGVERILKERLPWVTDVLGGVDDSLSLDESAALGSGGYVPSL